jgi:rhodanese-related sulfurtransferase
VLTTQNQKEVGMKLKIFIVLAIAVFVVPVMAIGRAGAFDQITAENAYKMVTTDVGGPKLKEVKSFLIDIRTPAEYCWVGNPADLEGNPIAYNIPYKLWTHRIDCETGNPILRTVKHLFGFLIRRTFPDKDTPLILLCRSGIRTDEAADYLETTLGYNNIYEIDRSDKTGRGGFQGSSKSSPPEVVGYRGWPGRCDPSESVSWMDSGLPITQKLDCDKFWPCMLRK